MVVLTNGNVLMLKVYSLFKVEKNAAYGLSGQRAKTRLE